MRAFTLAAGASTLLTAAVSAAPLLGLSAGLSASLSLSLSLKPSNNYGAPIEPWKNGHYPGWCYGDKPSTGKYHGIPWSGIVTIGDDLLCTIFNLVPLLGKCPLKDGKDHGLDGYKHTFTDLDAAIIASDYLTYGLSDTVEGCLKMCDAVAGCDFVNTYYDVNAQVGKNGSDKLTCALFSSCHTKAEATNYGGQSIGTDGSLNKIEDSNGWCKA